MDKKALGAASAAVLALTLAGAAQAHTVAPAVASVDYASISVDASGRPTSPILTPMIDDQSALNDINIKCTSNSGCKPS